jgi:hypothetical protein
LRALGKIGLAVGFAAMVAAAVSLPLFIFADQVWVDPREAERWRIRLLFPAIFGVGAIPVLAICAYDAIVNLPCAIEGLKARGLGREIAEAAAEEALALSKEMGVQPPKVVFEANFLYMKYWLGRYRRGGKLIEIYVDGRFMRMCLESLETAKKYVRYIVAHEFAHHVGMKEREAFLFAERRVSLGTIPPEVALMFRTPNATAVLVKHGARGRDLAASFKLAESANKHFEKIMKARLAGGAAR